MRRGTHPRATVVFLLIVPVLTGSCVPSTLNTTQLERRLERQLVAQFDVDGIEVTCPVEIEAGEGERFVCRARAPDDPAELRIRVTQVDDDGNVTWEIAGAAG